jgi:BirA family biotin operon repressor/biotin-[acetyl-CoA-carboxylase] ligase
MSFKEIDLPVLLYLSDKEFITVEKLSKSIGISRDAVWKQVQKLKEFGYSIATDNKRGYRIISRPDILFPTEIQRNLHTKYIGKRIYYFLKVDSTNTLAKRMLLDLKDQEEEGTVIIAEKQGRGKGRLGKEWFSPSGGIWISILLYPDINLSYLSLITLMASVSIAKAINEFLQINTQIKWPNDILFKDKKICGILTETRINSNNTNCVIVGIGINVNIKMVEFPENIRMHLTSLQEITGEKVSRVMLTRNVFSEFEKYYEIFKEGKFSLILNEWKLLNNTIGKNIAIDTGSKIVTGEVIDITEKGGLILVNDDGQSVEIISGTIIR